MCDTHVSLKTDVISITILLKSNSLFKGKSLSALILIFT